MRYYINLFLCSTFLLGYQLKADDGYRYRVNLRQITNDKVKVELFPPQLSNDSAEFLFPAMVPGTYEVYDFGRFVSNLTATGKNGVTIKVRKKNVNSYVLSPAAQIEKISYEVDDTFDKTDLPGTTEKVIFEPGGTNFEEGKNVSLNTHSMFGYFSGMLKNKYRIEFTKPKGFYPATGLVDITLGDTSDVIGSADYHELADSPIMYCIPDTTTVQVANTKVLVACYSPAKRMTSAFIASTLKPLLNVQRDYLGGELPVSKYAFLFYFADKPTLSGASGALEHSYSSFYVLPELDSIDLKQQIRDVAAHEFFHIVTPLGIHSQEIGEFDFNNPRMSRHLWLYEGMTEYAAHHAQVKGGLIGLSDFLTVMMQKYANSVENYNDTMSFTWMSRNVLDPKIHEQYGNVYEKGAVIGMCLDLLLRDLSNGSYGTQDLMRDLAKKYGKDRSFKDDELFADIEKLTYPQVGEFLRTHVGGKTPLPMAVLLAKAGIDFVKEQQVEQLSLGNPGLNFNQETNRIFVEDVSDLDAFGKKLKYRKGDELYKLNGKELTLQSLRDVITHYYETVKVGDKVVVEVYRPKGKSGEYKLKRLSAKARMVKVVKKNQVNLASELSEKQKLVLRTWVGL
jgi:predicted metalloprotease with PDZ domain